MRTCYTISIGLFPRWRIDFPEFARYFNTQWILGNFTKWKIYCSEAGIASTNNALESFNNVIKRCYTFNARYSCLH